MIVYLGVAVLARDWLLSARFAARQPQTPLAFAASHMFEVAWKGSLVLLVWSAADYMLERQRHENELKMSKQDLRDEFKETEGNPAVKQRIRRLQRQARRRRMLKDVERAAVVITNPTEFAIALEYRMEMDAPVVVAKGRNLLAAQIKEIAALARHSSGREPAAGPRPLPRGGSGAGHSSATLYRGRGNSGGHLAGPGARGTRRQRQRRRLASASSQPPPPGRRLSHARRGPLRLRPRSTSDVKPNRAPNGSCPSRPWA